MKTVVIGCGAAGFYAAKRLKKNDPSMEVTLLEATDFALYSKMRLPEYVAGTLPREKLFLGNTDDLDFRSGEKVVAIDRTAKTVTTEKGSVFPYDKLILATGADANVPPVPGLKENAYVLRTLADADALAAGSGKTALVLGGGLLGLEAAWALKNRNYEVTVAEMMDRLLPRQLNAEESARLLSVFQEMGYRIELNAVSVSCEPGSVTLKDGRILSADVILVSAGIASCKSLAELAGLVCGRGIKVDSTLRTSDSDIFAVGDCAEIDGRTIGLWMAAKDQGEAAADLICCVRENFVLPAYNPKLKVSGIDFNRIKGA
ncbi:MAG: NAD(P)/FAD-dependent oxidoreductase [Lentisphaeria bacterium]|nr:NAD(P)/FAD-dependent oxidoreductase [Lentisphaeria bacterium]